MRTALRKARLRAGLTQAELAKRVGLTRASYTNIEKGHKHPSLTTALRIARVLSEPVEDLFADSFPGRQACGSRHGRDASPGAGLAAGR